MVGGIWKIVRTSGKILATPLQFANVHFIFHRCFQGTQQMNNVFSNQNISKTAQNPRFFDSSSTGTFGEISAWFYEKEG